MIHSLPSWPQLTRNGIPGEFRIIRMPLLLDGREVAVGETVQAEALLNNTRLRVLFEQRRIEPVSVPVRRSVTVQPAVESRASRPATTVTAVATDSVPFLDEPIPVAEEKDRYAPSQRRKGARR